MLTISKLLTFSKSKYFISLNQDPGEDNMDEDTTPPNLSPIHSTSTDDKQNPDSNISNQSPTQAPESSHEQIPSPTSQTCHQNIPSPTSKSGQHIPSSTSNKSDQHVSSPASSSGHKKKAQFDDRIEESLKKDVKRMTR